MAMLGPEVEKGLLVLGMLTSVLVVVAMLKLAYAFKSHCDFDTAVASVPPKDSFSTQTFWITGASSGIGKSLALHLCSKYDGITLVLSSRREEALNMVMKECQSRATSANINVSVKILPLDLNNHKELPSKAKEALSLCGNKIDVLVNNGGITMRSTARDSNTDVDRFVTDVDYLSHVTIVKSLLPAWDKSHKGTNDRPVIINTLSVAAKFGAPVRTAYSGAKHAVMGWFDSFRVEQIVLGKPFHILNVVLGSTKTNASRNAVTRSPSESFGDKSIDNNIASGLDPDKVVERIVAAKYAGIDEMWIAPRMEMTLLYLIQYIPDTSRRIMTRLVGKKYAVEKERA